MNLQEALLLMERMKGIADPLRDEAFKLSLDPLNDTRLAIIPFEFSVLTKDGDAFGVQYFTGWRNNYSDTVVYSPDVLSEDPFRASIFSWGKQIGKSEKVVERMRRYRSREVAAKDRAKEVEHDTQTQDFRHIDRPL